MHKKGYGSYSLFPVSPPVNIPTTMNKILLLFRRKKLKWKPRPELSRERSSVLDKIIHSDWYTPKNLKQERKEKTTK